MRTDYKPLYPLYREYYERMAKSYFSENEKIFFETMKHRQQHVFTWSNDLLMSEHDNDDDIYIVRHNFDEFKIGRKGVVEHFYAMDIIEAMSVNLKAQGLLDRNMTMQEWLRERDYEGIRYDGNFDEL